MMPIHSDIPPSVLHRLDQATFFNYGHLPIAAAYCRSLGLVELVDRLVPSRMELHPGLVVQAMVLDTLSGRTPLYRLEQFLAGQDIELLLGKDVPPHTFNDTNLARALDAIFAAGPAKIVTELGIRATQVFGLDTSVPSYDTTSTSVWGDYRACENEPPPPGPRITYGHSKDHLPELKQFMTELLCVDRGVPIFGQTRDGNSSDKTSNNQMLSRISSIMAKHGLGPGAFVYVADSAMVTGDNLNALGKNLFVSRLPANYGECGRVIADAVASAAWVDVGSLAENSAGKTRPCAMYRTHESTVELHGKSYRAVVVHSSSHDQRRQKKLAKTIAASAKAANTELAKLALIYSCEADAQAAAERGKKLAGRLHTTQATILPVETRRRGRPSAKSLPPTNIRYKLSFDLVQNNDAVERERRRAGCFVLATNVSCEGENAMDSEKVLGTYKGQYGVENDFVFLKDPLIVNDLFLKKPARIDALGMILIIALMIWRLMERSMRAHVENTQTTLPGWDKRETNKPTAFMMTTKMTGIVVAKIENQRYLLRGPSTNQLLFLEALGLSPPVFTNPQHRCKPVIPLKTKQKK